ncbi:AI-2E family transporter [Enterococcus sp.]|uniref:AI-2E family transporter n=1 Tax=Enterococcus sp. TaxID=35783 RepID=UPI002FC8B307
MKRIDINWNQWIIRFTFAMLVIIGYKVISNYNAIFGTIKSFTQILSPFVIGFVIAYLLNGPQELLKKLFNKSRNKFVNKNQHGLSVLLLYLILIFLIFLLLNFIVPLLITNLIDLLKLLPSFINYLSELVTKLENDGLIEFLSLEKMIQNVLANFSLEKLLSQWSQSLTSIGQLSVSLSSIVINSALSFIISIYVLAYKTSLLDFSNRFFGKLLPQNAFLGAKYWIQTTNRIFYKFISSQFLDACIIAVSASIILSVLRVPFGVSLGLFLGISNMIPYFGSIVASVVTAIITFFTSGLNLAIITLISLTVLQQVDGNFIGPRIMAGALNLNPIVIIISITIGGAYFGVIGMFLAVPVAAIAKIITMNWLDKDQITPQTPDSTDIPSIELEES